ncbi:type II toxin-antitoxin system RelE/ParE family toxin [Maricaulis salignorans]|uniref:type II toxin-antitoxin system RelE/ParE family toxin n=1 Tax=Maricaulis salignorans TaxID=144026 RepID=UPI003A93DAD9
MAGYRLTIRAEADVEAIYEYSILNFGLERASTYFDSLFDRFALLARYPGLGHDYGHITPGLRRFEQARHSIYYSRLDDGDVQILRILGQWQDPLRHL